MMQPLISVIVPVYKVEKYLERCVTSIQNQTYTNLEIILVDDGSPDRSGELCEELAKQDSRIRVLHKENGGLSSARNAGLKIAKGQYVGFVDSDDWIGSDMYGMMYSLISKHNAQIAVCGLQCDHSDGSVSWFNSEYPKDKTTKLFSKHEALRELTKADKITNSACDKLFAKKIIENLPMKEGIIYEDTQIMHLWMEKADRVVYTPMPYYHYIMTDTSITRGGFKASRFAIADVLWERVEYYKENYPQLACYAISSYISVALDLIVASVKVTDCRQLRRVLIQKVRMIEFKDFFSVCGIHNRFFFLLLKINVELYTLVRRIFLRLGIH